MLENSAIAFIGGGNMASSIIGGLCASGVDATCLRVADPSDASRERLVAEYPGLHVSADNGTAVAGADLVLLAVKPQVLHTVLQDIGEALRAEQALVVSIAAGIPVQAMHTTLGAPLPVVRCMPNTPALLQSGASGLFASPEVSDSQRALADTVLGAVGSCCWVTEEAQLEAVTALSGSGPAYFFLLMETMIDAAVAQGLPRDTATTLAVDTALGAARMARESDTDLAELRRRVTSPGGTTQAAVETFESSGLRDIVARAMQAAAARAVEMAEEMTPKPA